MHTKGGIITSDPEASMEALEYVDIGVIGEGEVTMYLEILFLAIKKKLSKLITIL